MTAAQANQESEGGAAADSVPMGGRRPRTMRYEGVQEFNPKGGAGGTVRISRQSEKQAAQKTEKKGGCCGGKKS